MHACRAWHQGIKVNKFIDDDGHKKTQYLPLLNADMIHNDTISELDFDAKYALITNHTVLYVCLLSDRHASTN